MWYFNLDKSCQFRFCEGVGEALQDAVCRGGEGWVLPGLLGRGQSYCGDGAERSPPALSQKAEQRGTCPLHILGLFSTLPK